MDDLQVAGGPLLGHFLHFPHELSPVIHLQDAWRTEFRPDAGHYATTSGRCFIL